MFNREVKERYFAEQNVNDNNRRYIERVGTAEDTIGMDICFASRARAIEAIQSMNAYDLGTFNTFISAAKGYAKWCYNTGIFKDAQYGILGVSANDINPQEFIRKNIFSTESDLIKSIQSVMPLYDGNIEVISCIFAWIGIQSPLDVHDSDVLLDERKIIVNGKTVVDGFSDFVHDFFEEYINLKSSTRDNGVTTYVVVKDRSYDTFIKRFCSPKSSKLGQPIKLQIIQASMGALNKKYEENGGVPRLTYRNIMKSGSLRRLYEAEVGGLKVFDSANKNIVEEFFGDTSYRSAIWLYKHYKAAFNL